MAAAVYSSEISQVLEDGREERRTRVRRTLVEQTVLSIRYFLLLRIYAYSDDCAAMSGTPRPSGLHKLHSKS